MTPAQPWHPYVFDTEKRAFVGEFEAMYQAELEGNFDSWHQSDPRRVEVRICSLLLERITWRTALDLGCGKGAFTANLKRRDNHVVGVDCSQTAIDAASGTFPDIEWVCSGISEYLERAEPVDLMLLRQVLSYLEDWREVLQAASKLTRYCIVELFIPPDAIGHVQSQEELRAELERHFEPVETVLLPRSQMSIHLVESRSSSSG